MPNRKKKYNDMRKFTKTRTEQRKRYYDKTAIYEPSLWTPEQEELVLNHDIPDSELSAIIHHSVRAIQSRRYVLKKKLQ